MKPRISLHQLLLILPRPPDRQGVGVGGWGDEAREESIGSKSPPHGYLWPGSIPLSIHLFLHPARSVFLSRLREEIGESSPIGYPSCSTSTFISSQRPVPGRTGENTRRKMQPKQGRGARRRGGREGRGRKRRSNAFSRFFFYHQMDIWISTETWYIIISVSVSVSRG